MGPGPLGGPGGPKVGARGPKEGAQVKKKRKKKEKGIKKEHVSLGILTDRPMGISLVEIQRCI